MSLSQSEIDEAIAFIAQNHPEYSIIQFKQDFKGMIEREPTFKENMTFQRIVSGIKNPKPPQKKKIINEYIFGDSLGEGSFGEVFKCQKGGKDYAVKCFKRSVAEIELDFANSFRLSSNFLVKYLESFRGPSGELYIAMELCPKGDLKSLIEKLKGLGGSLLHERVFKILIQLLLGLYDMHLNNILHRDLKPGNVFADDEDNVKIGDFGMAKKLDSTEDVQYTARVGTPLYEAPEVLRGDEYGPAADMWSLGVLLYELCTFNRPFDESNIYKLQQLIFAGKFKAIPKERAPAEIIDIVNSLLIIDQTKRPSALDLLRLPVCQSYATVFDLLRYFPTAAKPQIAPSASASASASEAPTPIADAEVGDVVVTAKFTATPGVSLAGGVTSVTTTAVLSPASSSSSSSSSSSFSSSSSSSPATAAVAPADAGAGAGAGAATSAAAAAVSPSPSPSPCPRPTSLQLLHGPAAKFLSENPNPMLQVSVYPGPPAGMDRAPAIITSYPSSYHGIAVASSSPSSSAQTQNDEFYMVDLIQDNSIAHYYNANLGVNSVFVADHGTAVADAITQIRQGTSAPAAKQSATTLVATLVKPRSPKGVKK